MYRLGTPLLAVGLALVLGVVGICDAEMLIDDFHDRNDDGWTHLDYTEGEPFGPATFDASSGAYHIASQGGHDAEGDSLVSLWNDSAGDVSFANGYVQARLRADNADTVAGITMRAGADGEGRPVGYGFVASANYGVIVVVRNDGATSTFISSLPNVGFSPGRDWIFKAGAFDFQLEFKAWPAGEDEPLLPQLTVSDSTYIAGQLGVQVAQSGGAPFRAFGATFDDILFIPELGADFDGDGDVDGADFLAWQRGESPNPLSSSDLADWQENFGTVASPISTASTAVPEPATALLLVLAATMVSCLRRRQIV